MLYARLLYVAGLLVLGGLVMTLGADWYDSGSVWSYADQVDTYPAWSSQAIRGNARILSHAVTVMGVGVALLVLAPPVHVLHGRYLRRRTRACSGPPRS